MTITAPSSASWLDDGLTTFAPTGGGIQTGYGKVSAAARVIDLGSAVTPWHGVVAFEPSVLDQSSGNEVYQLYVEGCASADFSGAKQDLASWMLGALNPQDVTALSNAYNDVVYRYIRLKIVVSGTTPQIAVKSFVRPLSDLDAYTLAELITLQHVLAQNIQNANTNFRAWMAGTVNGGPNSDGKYPLSDGLGHTVLVACPAKIAAEGGSGYSNSLREVNVGGYGTNEAALNSAAAAVYDSLGVTNKVLTGNAGVISVSGYKNWENRNIDLPPLLIGAGNNIANLSGSLTDSGTVSNNGLPITTYVQGDPHVNHEIRQRIVGPVIDIGGNTVSVNQHLTKRLSFIGYRANQTQATVALRIRDDQRANTRYELTVSDHLGDGLELKDNTEKKRIFLQCLEVRGGYCLTVRSTQTYDAVQDRYSATDSVDEVKVFHNSTACDRLYYGMDGVQASITHECNVEALTPGAGNYAAVVMTRKSEKWIGEIRGCTGRLMWVGSRTDGHTGGGCHLNFDLNVIQLLNGNVYLANPKNVTGRIVFNLAKTNDAGQPNPLTDEATMTVGSVRGYCNLTVEMRRCTSPAGLDVGDETYPGPVRTGSDGTEEIQDFGLSFDNKSLNVAIEMGSFEGGTVNPNTLWALRLRAGVNSTINCAYLAGNVLIKAGWQRGTINVPAAWVRSGGSVTIDPLASTEMNVHGPMDLSEVIAIPWTFKGLKILSVNDFDGAGIQYNGSAWVPLGPVCVPAVSLAARGSPHNQAGLKWRGASRINTGDAWGYVSAGAAQTDAWQYHGGAIVPDWLPETDAFEARAVAAGSSAFTDAERLAYDRFFHDLIAAGVYDSSDMDASVVKAFYAMMGPNLAVAKTNMLFSDWPLTTFGSIGHTAKIGLKYSGTHIGAYSEVTGWSAAKHGTDRNYIAIIGGSEELLDSEQSSNVNGGPFFSFGTHPSANWRGTFHRLDGGDYSQLLTETPLAAPALGGAIPYRLGMAWTPDNTSQSVYMFGGQPIQAAKVLADETVNNIYFGRSRDAYLKTSLSFGGIASGAVTNEQAAAILRAINTLRNALKAF